MTMIFSDSGATFPDNSVQPSAAFPQVFQLPTPTLGSNALTIPATAAPISLGFRSTTLGAGGTTYVTGTPAALTIPSTATLGTVNAVQSTLVVLVLNNAGTLEYGVVNIAGGNDLSETGLISTTAISAAATSANVIYSNSARTNVAYRVVGRIDSTQATAGTWVTAPSLVQGVGGQALTAMSSLGYGQTWQDVTGSRAIGTTYYNTTGKPIQLSIIFVENAIGSGLSLTIGGVQVATRVSENGSNANAWIGAEVVPPGASYSVANIGTASSITKWTELR